MKTIHDFAQAHNEAEGIEIISNIRMVDGFWAYDYDGLSTTLVKINDDGSLWVIYDRCEAVGWMTHEPSLEYHLEQLNKSIHEVR